MLPGLSGMESPMQKVENDPEIIKVEKNKSTSKMEIIWELRKHMRQESSVFEIKGLD